MSLPVRDVEARGLQVLKEFREFAMKGNVVDLAVGVIIGAAFGGIVTSLVGDIIMPIVGAIFGGPDFANHFVLLGDIPATFKGDPASYAALKAAGVAVLGWGQFVTVVINFLILAFIIFLLIRMANRMMVKKEAAPAEPPADPAEVLLLREIRDALRNKG